MAEEILRADGRRTRHEHRRPELLRGATDYVLQHGVGDLSMRPLADALGISHATLLHHFGSKEQLLSEVIADIRGREPLIGAPGPDAEDPAELLRALWKRWSSPELAPVFRLLFELYAEALRHPDRYRAFLRSVISDWLDVGRHFAREAGCPPEQVDAVATGNLAQIRGLLLDLLTTGDRDRIDAAFDLFVERLTDQRNTWRTATETS